jgi:phosphohistidine phosphatase SixA
MTNFKGMFEAEVVSETSEAKPLDLRRKLAEKGLAEAQIVSRGLKRE